MHTPGQAAAHLEIESSTLRRWARQFQAFLSPAAEPGAARRYTDADLAILQQIKALLGEGKTVAEVRSQIASIGHERVPDEHPPINDGHPPINDGHPSGTQVLLLDEHRPELEALRSLLASQQQLVQHQQAHLEAQAMLIDQQQQMLESRNEELDRARADLERARSEHAALLDRLPRWVKHFWGA